MEFIIEDGYEVKAGMEEEFQRYLADTADRFRAALPEGVEYMGDYVVTWGNDLEAGGWHRRRRGPDATRARLDSSHLLSDNRLP